MEIKFNSRVDTFTEIVSVEDFPFRSIRIPNAYCHWDVRMIEMGKIGSVEHVYCLMGQEYIHIS